MAPGTRIVLDTSLGPPPAFELPPPDTGAPPAHEDGGGAVQRTVDEQ